MAKAKPRDQKLYDQVKKKLYKRMTTHSAYRSSILVKEYKQAFKKKHGKEKSPYLGAKPKTGLTRWHKEKWRSDTGKDTYEGKKDAIFRPTKRVTAKTPTTMSELSSTEIKRAKKEKKLTGRVKKFKNAKDKVVRFEKGTGNKKYKAIILSEDGKQKTIQFGDRRYGHFKDSTPLKTWSSKDHGDVKRKRAYFNRHSGVPTKTKAIEKEMKLSGNRLTAKILSHKYLW